MVSAVGIIIAVICFVYFSLSLFIFILTMVLYCKNKRKLKDSGLEFNLPRFTWFLLYFVFLAFVMLLGLDQLLNIGSWVLAVFLVFLVLSNIPMCCTGQNCAMCHMSDIEGGVYYAQQMRDTRPQLYFHIECWHFVTVKVAHYTTDDYGNRYIDYYTDETHKVTTVNVNKYFGIPYWCDFTDPLFLPAGRLLVHVMSTSRIIWMDDSIDRLRNKLERIYSCLDDHYSISQHESIPGVIDDKMIVTGDAKDIPCLLNACMRVLWIMFGFGLSLAIYIATVASVVRYQIVKKCSMSDRCVTPDWCRQNNVDYVAVVATYNVEDLENIGADKTGNADVVTKPCIQNPLPLICTERKGVVVPANSKVVPIDGTVAEPQPPTWPQQPQEQGSYPPPPIPQTYPSEAAVSQQPQEQEQVLYPPPPQVYPAETTVPAEENWLYPGQVIIKVNKAINLPEADITSPIDPYFVFHLNGKSVKSSVKIDSKDPTFNETMDPLEYNPSSRCKVVVIELFDKDVVKDELCAKGEFTIDEFLNNKKTSWFELKLLVEDIQKDVVRHPQVELEVVYNAQTGDVSG